MTDFETQFRLALLNEPAETFKKIESAVGDNLYRHHSDAMLGKMVREVYERFVAQQNGGKS